MCCASPTRAAILRSSAGGVNQNETQPTHGPLLRHDASPDLGGSELKNRSISRTKLAVAALADDTGPRWRSVQGLRVFRIADELLCKLHQRETSLSRYTLARNEAAHSPPQSPSKRRRLAWMAERSDRNCGLNG